MNVAIGSVEPFEYFDELRKIIETARQDVFFVDPFLDSDFVSRYLRHVVAGVTIRLLTRKHLGTLIPAVELFASQTGLRIEVRSINGLHDRHLFIDRKECHQSRASFKDGAMKAPTTLTQIVDAFAAVFKTYEDMWNAAKTEYPVLSTP